ncbi:hypothetical protein D3C76_1666860 [compost metagenome]
MVPKHFTACLWNREWGATISVLDSQPIFGRTGIDSVFRRIVVEPLWSRGCTVSVVHIYAVVRVVLKHVIHAFGKLRLVLIGVSGSDLKL